MLAVYHKQYEIEISSYINREGNTSYMLDVFDYSRGGIFVYRFVRYQWVGGSQYLICADENGWCYPCTVRIKDLLDGFNWSHVRRAIREQIRLHNAFFAPTLPF